MIIVRTYKNSKKDKLFNVEVSDKIFLDFVLIIKPKCKTKLYTELNSFIFSGFH